MGHRPVELFLDGGLGTIPLAPVADLAGRSIEAVVEVIAQRLDESPPEVSGLLGASTSVLLGLRYPAEMIQILLRGTRQMKESTMHQAILAEGAARGELMGKALGFIEGEILQARRVFFRQGERRFGPITVADRGRVEAITALDRLEALIDLVVEMPAVTWAEFWTRWESP